MSLLDKIKFKLIAIFLLFTFIFPLHYCKVKEKIEIKINKIPTSVLIGDTILVKWQVENVDTLMFFPKGVRLDNKGEMHIIADTSIRYIFRAYHGKSRASKGFNVFVLKPELYVQTPIEVNDEDSFVVTYYTKNSSYFKTSLSDIKYPANGSLKLKLDSSQFVEFFAYNKNNYYVSQKKYIKVRLIEDFKYTSEVKKGEMAFILWKYKHTKKVYIKELDKWYLPKDTARFYPTESKTYNLLVFRNNGDTLKKKVFVKVREPGILSFSCPNYVYKGQEAYLTWQTVDPDSVNISGIAYSLPATGKIKVKPDSTTIYTLNFFKNGEKHTSQCRIVVIKNRKIITQSISYAEAKKKKSRFDFDIYATDFSHYPDSVKLYVLVVDTFGNFICDLAPPFGDKETADKFFKGIVEVNAKKQNHKVKNFRVEEVHEKRDIPVDINITLDYSGSMAGNYHHLGSAFEYFVKNKPPLSRISVVRFDDSVALEIPLNGNSNEILNKVKKTKEAGDFGGGTALYAAADEGLISLENSPNPKIQVLFTDGYENSSMFYFGSRAVFAQDVVKKAKSNNVKINVIAFGESVNSTLLKFMTSITGGTFYNIYNPLEIIKIMKEILYLTRNYYVITYKPYFVMDGNNTIQLNYNNNSGQITYTEREVFIGDNFDLFEYENIPAGNYWKKNTQNSSNTLWANKKIIALPQIVAYFDFNKTDLKKQYLPTLDKYVKFMKDSANVSVVIFGHTDQVGTIVACNELSKNRALVVKNYFVSKGIDESRIFIEACGKNNPIWKEEDQPWKAMENRRVELLFVK